MVEQRDFSELAALVGQTGAGPLFSLPALPDGPLAPEAALEAPPYVHGGSVYAAEAEMRDILAQAGAPAEWVDDLLSIAWCESKWRPWASGDGGNSLGAWQLWTGWFAAGEDPFDALTNARVAVRVRETRGRYGGGGGWTCATLLGIP